MSISCTYGDLAALRDQGSRIGPLTKLNKLGEDVSLVDRARIARFVSPIIKETVEYEKTHLQLLELYGKRDDKSSLVFSIPPESAVEYEREFKRLQATTCEIAVVPLQLDTCEKLPLTPADLLALEKFMEVLP